MSKSKIPEVEGKVAIVTGSTRGIGRSVAEALVGAGARVMISGRDREEAETVADELSGRGPGSAAGIACDVRDAAACRALVEETAARFGRIDILVNNAGVGRFAAVHDMDPVDWDTVIRTNLDGVFHCSRAAVPHLIEGGGGWILNIGSLAGRNTFAGGVAYNASKFGLLGMTEAMMLDLRYHDIRVSCIMPGSVNTYFSGAPDPSADWKLTGEDIAQVVMDLVSFPERALPSRVEIRPSRPRK